MLIRIPRRSDPRPSEITPEPVWQQRRRFVEAMGLAGIALATPGLARAAADCQKELPRLKGVKPSRWKVNEPINSFRDITHYNNFYELGTDKRDPARFACHLEPRPWTVVVDGLCERPTRFDIDELLTGFPLEERIYRLRCVEAWSMVIPWVGFPLSLLLDRVKPLSSAKFVAFESIYDPKMLPGQRRRVLDWPYREGLRMDEARHPLAILAVGLYGKELPRQNGAPVRLVVPWKYGFKSIKSIVRISLVEKQPPTTWNRIAPDEYGFYANVNPQVDHPRWSQQKERRIGEFLRRETLMFNGYGEEVASLYRGMDLNRWY